MLKAQVAALFAASLAFIGRFAHVVFLFWFLLCYNLLKVRTNESGFSLASLAFPDIFEKVFPR